MLPSDYRLALEALNRGRPLALRQPQHTGGRVQRSGRALATIDPEPQQSAPAGGGFFGRLTGRG